MDYMGGGDLFALIESIRKRTRKSLLNIRSSVNADDIFPTCQRLSYMLQMAKGIGFLHKNGIVHRDIKPRNMLLSEDLSDLKLADFGLAKKVASRNGTAEDIRTSTSAKPLSRCGTATYMAPEIDGRQYNRMIDVYAYGISFLEVTTFRIWRDKLVGLGIMQRGLSEKCKDISDVIIRSGSDCRVDDLIQECILDNPAKRPIMAEAIERLKSVARDMEKSQASLYQEWLSDLVEDKDLDVKKGGDDALDEGDDEDDDDDYDED
mmetsp:Transcript_1671/g.4559  ORF Transcript_1671/g.4559 Transcript_1671/m.4559 type:complete len:263 (-) Transcript_1671:54-842(-)